ncbi:MAG: SurA N-terminal domain-containing protein [Deltaproteobacteria bacterium]|nr:SurA N-terminal domain-containing protein [Deltaproteobacteria bacterium]
MTCHRLKRLLVVWLMGAAVAAASVGASAETANRLVAVVNDDVITLHELHKKMKEMTGVDPGMLRERNQQQYNDARRMILERLIEDRIALEKIREIGIEVKDGEVDDAIERIKRDNHWSRSELESMLKDKGLTWEEYRQNVKEDLQRYKLVNFEVKSRIIIRDEQVEAYYEEHKERFQRKPGVEIATIFLLRKNPGDAGEPAGLEQEGAALVKQLREGSHFAELARLHSDGPGAEEGGYLGRFDPNQLEPEIRKVIEETPEGGVSEPIIKPNGVQIIKVLDKGGTGVMPLEKVRDAIYRILLREEIDRRYSKWIQGLKEKTYTKVLFD